MGEPEKSSKPAPATPPTPPVPATPPATPPSTASAAQETHSPLFVAVGYNGLQMSSEDGKEWKNVQTGNDGEVYRNICYGNGLYVAVGSYGIRNYFASTRDGVKWKKSSVGAPGVYHLLSGVIYGNGMFIAYGGDGTSDPAGNILYQSKDGVAWSTVMKPQNRRLLRRVTFGNGKFVGCGEFGRRTVSEDGLKWTDAPEAKDTFKETLINMAYGNGIFVGVGIHSLRMSSKDGTTWENKQSGEEGEHLNSVVWAGDRFVATGPNVTYISSDGATWKRVPVKQGPLTMALGNSRFIGTRGNGRIIVSEDAIEWTQVFKAPFSVEGICYG